MSQLVSDEVPMLRSPALSVDERSREEFSYVPVSPLAPLTLFVGVCSAASLLTVMALPVAGVAILLGLVCLWQIRRADGELGGRLLARLGIGVAVSFLFAGAGYHSYVYATEVPEGFERVSFSWLSKQEPKFENGKFEVAPEVAALDGKPIFIKGYMYPQRITSGLTEFVLLKDTGECCFGGNPKLTDMIVVKFQNGMTVNHREQQLVNVAGIFRAKQVVQSGELTAVYSLEGTHFQ